MIDFPDHAKDCRITVQDYIRADLIKSQGMCSLDLVRLSADCAFNQLNFDFTSHFQPHISFRVLPLSAAIFLASIMLSNPEKTALTMLMLFFVPRDLLKISVTPTASITARTGPPAITPVPGAAGLSITFALLNSQSSA